MGVFVYICDFYYVYYYLCVSFVTTDEFCQWGSQKLLQGLLSHELTAYLSIFNQFKLNELWPYYQKHVNQIILNHTTLKLSFTNIWGLCSNFVDCESFIESNSPDILALCETNLHDSIDSGNFSVRDYPPLTRKDSNAHGLAVFVKERFSFAHDLSLANSADSYLCFRLALLHSVSYFFLYRSPSSSTLCMFLILFHQYRWCSLDQPISLCFCLWRL